MGVSAISGDLGEHIAPRLIHGFRLNAIDAYLEQGATNIIDRVVSGSGTSQSAIIVVQYEVTLAEGETLRVYIRRQHGEDTSNFSFLDDIYDITHTGGTGGTTENIISEIPVSFQDAYRYLRLYYLLEFSTEDETPPDMVRGAFFCVLGGVSITGSVT